MALALVILAVLLLLAAGAWWWSTRSASTSTSNASGPVTVAPAALPAPDGPVLTDTAGVALPTATAERVRTLYTALGTRDTATISALYRPARGAASWPSVAPRLTPQARDGLLTALRSPAARPPEVTYLYRHGPYGVGLHANGTVAFFGTDQAPHSTTDAGDPGSGVPSRTSTNPAGGGPVPTLGAAGWRPSTTGYGQVRPTEANAAGDGTSVVTNLRWKSWGGPTATATGTASWVPPSGISADGVQTPAVVIASSPGPCHGHYGYRKITWYFPSRGETPSSSEVSGYPDICTPMS